MIKIEIPFGAVTMNKLYKTIVIKGKVIRAKTNDAKKFETKVKKIVEELNPETINGEIKEVIRIYSKWYNNDGTIKKKDLVNYEKGINDAIFLAIPHMDDSQIFEIKMEKIHSIEEKIEVFLWKK